jgi:glyoxalase family protein
MKIGGLHHITAVTANARANVAFYTQVLGLRLVKKTVNQDDVSAYHLFYGDAVGSAGTELTFFDWAQAGPNVPGAGTIACSQLRVVDAAALYWWQQRFREHGVRQNAIEDYAGIQRLPFWDPEGQALALVAAEGTTPYQPWAGCPVPAAHAVRGLHSIVIRVHDVVPSVRLLEAVLGMRALPVAERSPDAAVAITVMAATAGPAVYVEANPVFPIGRVGAGGVHHAAFRTADAAEQLRWRERLLSQRVGVSEQIDRFYFQSIYFREPSRILYEIATDGPGFAMDEESAHLGERLALPPFLEARRAQIEAGLQPL